MFPTAHAAMFDREQRLAPPQVPNLDTGREPKRDSLAVGAETAKPGNL